MSRVLFIFIDGIGIGRNDAAVNPFVGGPILGSTLPDDWRPPPGGGRPATLPVPVLPGAVPHEGRIRAIDASLGFPGLPQSATGQTTLFTGVNGAEVLGHHLYGFPGPRLKSVLLEHSILKRAHRAGRRAAFLNAFSPLFFELGEEIWERRMSASSWNNRAAGLPFMTVEDVRAGRALFHDFSMRDPRLRGLDLAAVDPGEAGRVLAGAAFPYNLSIYEFFLSDQVGHTGDLAAARRVAGELEEFLAGVLRASDLETSHVVVTSDHGNMEDMSVKSHTHNPVPALIWGPEADRLIAGVDRLEDFAALFLDAAGVPSGGRSVS